MATASLLKQSPKEERDQNSFAQKALKIEEFILFVHKVQRIEVG